ncbi:MAG: TlpA disulfide reductase family protein [Flammeovirgaceae bacterium]
MILIFPQISCQSNPKESNTVNTQNGEILVNFSGKIQFPKKDGVIKIFSIDRSGGQIELANVKVGDDGKFEQKIVIKEPHFYLLNIYNEKEELIILTGEDVELSILEDGQNRKVEVLRSEENKLLKKFDAMYADLNVEREKIIQKYREQGKSSTETQMAMTEEYNEFIKGAFEKMKKFVIDNQTPLISLRVLDELDPETELAFYENTLQKLSEKYPSVSYVKDMQEKIQGMKRIAVGSNAPDIQLTDPNGKIVSLSSLKGKVVLIDFWASWCGPCRKENPNVVRMYEKFKNKGFEIYGVSLDKDKQAWLDAIQKDGLKWIHVSDLKFWQSDAAKLYNISAIPMTVLLDKEGKIIAKNLRGKALEDKLNEIL